MAKFELTEEGKDYLINGLPEKRLVEFLKEGLNLEEISQKVRNLHIAIQWAKKKGWIRFEKNKITLIKYPEKIEEEEALRAISEGKDVDEKILKVLIQRKLVKKVTPEEERAREFVGKEVLEVTPELIKTGLWRKVRFKTYNVGAVGKRIYPGSTHPYQQIIDEIREILVNLGFVEAKGPIVELNFWNCDALFMPSDHPARGIHDIYLLKKPMYGKVMDRKLWKRVGLTHVNGWRTGSKGWGNWDSKLARRLILRSQNTAISARVLASLKEEDIPFKMFALGKVFRPDVIDAKHFVEFEQFEGIVVGRKLNIKHILGYLKEISFALGAKKIRFKPSYFPFTEPSVEAQVFIKNLGWVELVGAGIFRPEVTLPLGIKYPVLAWGGGLGRLAMVRLGIDDIRKLYSKDLEWLRQKVIV